MRLEWLGMSMRLEWLGMGMRLEWLGMSIPSLVRCRKLKVA